MEVFQPNLKTSILLKIDYTVSHMEDIYGISGFLSFKLPITNCIFMDHALGITVSIHERISRISTVYGRMLYIII